MRYLFIAPMAHAWGELTLGLRAADELRRRGHAVFFLVAAAQLDRARRAGFEATALREGRLGPAIAQALKKKRIEAIVLVDASTWLWALKKDSSVKPRFLRELGLPIFALDVWGVRERGFSWDLGRERMRPDLEAIEACTLIGPAPFSRPRAKSYGALPSLSPISKKERRQFRAELGISSREKLVIFPSAAWQTGHPAQRDHSMRAALYLPLLVATYLLRAGRRLRLLHVGPVEEAPLARVLGDRYVFAGQLDPRELERRMRAADLMLSFNMAATTIGTAIALRLPILVGINSLRAEKAKQAVARLERPPSKVLARWIEKVVPIERFAVWPIGFHRVMQRALRDNPLASALRIAEVLDEDGFVEQLSGRWEIHEEQAAYAKLITALPTAADMLVPR